ncbi:MAG: ribulokinase [Lentisphaeria bacterium]|nr:ribulokinase [Lentisphaeria bacterium]
MAREPVFAIGLDYGSNSVRCLVVDVRDGREAGSAVWEYPSGDSGVLTDPGNPHVARQSPADFVAGLEGTIPEALRAARAACPEMRPERVIGIGVDTTGSTPIPVDRHLQPLALQKRFRRDLGAQAWMWKDHSGMDEAEAITALAREHRPHYLAKCGGTYSSEWYFSKIWHCLRQNREVFDAAYTWLEFADFIPAVLSGLTSPDGVRAGICPAGHKAMYCDEWGGYPDAEFLSLLSPEIGALRERLPARAFPADQVAGRLCAAWAGRLGLPAGIPVAVGAFDAHLGAVGAGVGPGRMVKIIGTSTCDVLVASARERLPDIPGVCGIVKGSVLPGYYGIEAGQSAVGDIFNWFVTEVCRGDASLHGRLTREAAALAPGASGLLALDWENGNRTILVDAKLTGLLVGLTLHSSQAEIYRALIEATAFGARRILDRIQEYGVRVSEVVCCGGIAEKNPLFMQIYADVLRRPMVVSASAQTCALGSAIMAAVAAGPAAGGYAGAEEAQAAICSHKQDAYRPDPRAGTLYDELYALYCELHDSFGVAGTGCDHYPLMKRLLDIRRKARA